MKLTIPDKICPHCGGIEWYLANKRSSYRCVKKTLEQNKISISSESKKRANDKYRAGEKYRKYYLSYYKANKEKLSRVTKQWRIDNKERYSAKVKELRQGYTDNLTEYYLRNLLAGKEPALNTSDIPQELIKLKRKQLKLYRDVKKIKNAANS